MHNYHAKIELISGIIRIYYEKRDDSTHNSGIPFIFSVFIKWIDPETVEVMGLSDKITPGIWKAIAIELHKYGIIRVNFSRYKNGKKIEKTVSLQKKWLT